MVQQENKRTNSSSGNLKLKFLREHGCPWDSKTCSSAAFLFSWNLALECLKYAHENGFNGHVLLKKNLFTMVQMHRKRQMDFLTQIPSGNLEFCLNFMRTKTGVLGIEYLFIAA